MRRIFFGSLVAAITLSGLTGVARADSDSAGGATTGYATVGYAYQQGGQVDLEAIAGRLGARFGSYFGVEGELGTGIDRHRFIYSPPCSGSICPLGPVVLMHARLSNTEAVYAVGFLPIMQGADLFVRAGYGFSDFSAPSSPYSRNGFSKQSFNFGAGGQYFIDGANGIRLDYTREEVTQQNSFGLEATGKAIDVWSVAYVRSF